MTRSDEGAPPLHQVCCVLTCSILLLAALLPVDAAEAGSAELSEEHRRWLADVALLITDRERDVFLALEEEYQRAAFIRAFWKARDPYPETERSELEGIWADRLAEARERFRVENDARRPFFLLNGASDQVVENLCRSLTWPNELWRYNDTSEQVRGRIDLLFYDPGRAGIYHWWQPGDPLSRLLGLSVLLPNSITLNRQEERFLTDWLQRALPEGRQLRTQPDLLPFLWTLFRNCPGDGRLLAHYVLDKADDGLTADVVLRSRLLAREKKLQVREDRWLERFLSHSTSLPEGTTELGARAEISQRGAEGDREVVEVHVAIDVAAAGTTQIRERPFFGFRITGELLRDGELFEIVRVDFSVPADGLGERASLLFERRLRAGEWRLVAKVEDLHGPGAARIDQAFEVSSSSVPAPLAAEKSDEPPAVAPAAVLRLTGPAEEILSGMARFSADVDSPRIRRVTFLLDDREVLTKGRPPYSVELDLGPVPRPRWVTARGFDDTGEQVAEDRLPINQGGQHFAVELVEIELRERSVLVEARFDVPEGKALDRLELSVDESPAVTLFGPPFRQRLPRPDRPVSVVRANAVLDDGLTAEDVLMVGDRGGGALVDVRYVQLTVVARKDGELTAELDCGGYQLLEDGVPQAITRCEPVASLPMHVAVLLDTSASMAPRLPRATEAALEFFRRVVEPQDRAALFAFHEQSRAVVPFTNELEPLELGLVGLVAERGTALFDAVVETLYAFQGISGQRALLLLSDGIDKLSRFGVEEALDYARHAGVTIHTVGLEGIAGSPSAKHWLRRLARETGGESFFIDSVDELGAVYERIEQDLRQRTLLAYQSTSTSSSHEFRRIEVRHTDPSVEVEAMAGYYP